MTDLTTDTPATSKQEQARKPYNEKTEFMVYFAIIFVATLPLAILTWALAAIRSHDFLGLSKRPNRNFRSDVRLSDVETGCPKTAGRAGWGKPCPTQPRGARRQHNIPEEFLWLIEATCPSQVSQTNRRRNCTLSI